MKKSFKKLSIVLLTFAAGQVEAKKDLYQPKSPWPFAPVEDAAVGVAGVVTLDHVEVGSGDQSAASGLLVAVPDAVPGVSYARTKDKDQSEEKTTKRQKRKNKKETSSSKSKVSKKKNNDNDDSSY